MNCDVRQPTQDAFTPATNAGKRYKLTLKQERGKISTPYVNLFNGSHIIAGTTTAKGLAVVCRLDRRKYSVGRKVSDADMAAINLVPDKFHGEWNYAIRPKEHV